MKKTMKMLMPGRAGLWQRALALCAGLAVTLPATVSADEDYSVIDSAQAAALGGATGGDEIRKIDNADGTVDLVHIFKSSGTFDFANATHFISGSGRVLAVGGGGSGGSFLAARRLHPRSRSTTTDI